MNQIDLETFKSSDLEADTTYSTSLVALKDGKGYPVYFYVGPQWGYYLKINDKKVQYQYNRLWNGSAKWGGFLVLDLSKTSITRELTHYQNNIKSRQKAINTAKSMIKSLENLSINHPELLI